MEKTQDVNYRSRLLAAASYLLEFQNSMGRLLGRTGLPTDDPDFLKLIEITDLSGKIWTLFNETFEDADLDLVRMTIDDRGNFLAGESEKRYTELLSDCIDAVSPPTPPKNVMNIDIPLSIGSRVFTASFYYFTDEGERVNSTVSFITNVSGNPYRFVRAIWDAIREKLNAAGIFYLATDAVYLNSVYLLKDNKNGPRSLDRKVAEFGGVTVFDAAEFWKEFSDSSSD